MKTKVYDYRSGATIVDDQYLEGIKNVLEGMHYALGKYDISHFKNDLSTLLKVEGWSDQVRVSKTSQISITSMREDIGLCAQTGNMARMYADMMKLQALYMDERIKAGIFIVPTKACAMEFGGNVANFERLVNELTNIFAKVITVPMAIVGFDNGKE